MMRVVCEEYTKLECRVIDSKNISIGSGIIAIRCAQLLEEGMDFDTLCQNAEQPIPHSKVFFCLKTLEYLQKGGRIGKVAALLGSAIALKPVISCNEEGCYYPIAKCIGRTPSIKKVLELAQKFADGCPKVMLAVMHGGAAEEAQALIEEVRKKIPQGVIEVRRAGESAPRWGCTPGRGWSAFACYADKKDFLGAGGAPFLPGTKVPAPLICEEGLRPILCAPLCGRTAPTPSESGRSAPRPGLLSRVER